VRAAVHHGGAGTTGAVLASGTPSLVVPFTMDQPFWGARVRKGEAHALGEAIRGERGVSTAVTLLGEALRA